MINFSKLPLRGRGMAYKATEELARVVDPATLDSLVSIAEEARKSRGVELSEESMYFIRFQVPPSSRYIAVVFARGGEGRLSLVAYYDEIEGMLKDGYASGDIKKLPGNPFDEI